MRFEFLLSYQAYLRRHICLFIFILELGYLKSLISKWNLSALTMEMSLAS